MSKLKVWEGIRSLGLSSQSLRHLSLFELLQNIIIFKICSYTSCVKFIVKHAFNPSVQLVMKYTAFNHFCAGTNSDDAKRLALKLQKNNVKTIVDHSVEELETPDAFKTNLENKISLIISLNNASSVSGPGRKDDLNYIPLKCTSLISPQVLEQLTTVMQKQDGDGAINKGKNAQNCNSNNLNHSSIISLLIDRDREMVDSGLTNLARVLSTARAHNCCILLDAEQSNRQPAIDLIARYLAQHFNVPGKVPHLLSICCIFTIYLIKR
jgi:hypothetical protein